MKYIIEVTLTVMMLFMMARLWMISCDLINSPSDVLLLVGIMGLGATGFGGYALYGMWRSTLRRKPSSQDNQTKEKQQ